MILNQLVSLAMEGIVIGIDRFVLSIPFKDSQPKAFIAHMWHVRHVATNIFNGRIKKTKNSAPRIVVRSDDRTRRLATITVGYVYGNPVLSFELNGSNEMSPKHIAELQTLFELCFDLGYPELYHRGKVRVIEFFIDVPMVPPNSLVLIDLGKRRRTIDRGTTYCGIRGSATVGVVYDKALQSKTTGWLTRIEVRLNRDDLYLRSLVEDQLPSPFEPFLVVTRETLQSVAHERGEPKLASAVSREGLHHGVKNGCARKSIEAALRLHSLPWWNSPELWHCFQDKLKGLTPVFTGNTHKEHVTM